MRVKFWGIRGSIPSPLTTEKLQEKLFHALSNAGGVDLSNPVRVREYIAGLDPWIGQVVGGNTTCVEIDAGGETLIIDCGSGMRELGTALMAREFGRGRGIAHIFLTHAHWDHLQGFPFFAPAYVPGNRLIFYTVGADPRQYLDHQQIAPTYFPITVREYPADIQTVRLQEGATVEVGRTKISNLALQHPGTAYAFRFDDGESTFVFASDGEYKALDDASLGHYIDFFARADAIAFDSQFSLRDLFLSKQDWGHSSVMIGVDIAEKAGIKQLVMVHYDPADSDHSIYEVAESARRYSRLNPIPGEVEVIVGTDGLELYLGQPLELETIEDTSRDVWLLAMAGSIYPDTAPLAEKRLADFLARAPNHRVILDLTLVASLDATGAAALCSAILATPDAEVAIVSPTPSVRRALRFSEASALGPIYRRRHHAFTALSGPDPLQRYGPLFGDRFRLGETIEADDFGVVYPVVEVNTGAELVAHVLGEESSAEFRQEFTARGRGWCELQHPLLVSGREVLQNGPLAAFIGERPAGQSWYAWLETMGVRADLAAALTCIRTIFEALRVLHNHNLLHGDLRPEYLLFRDGTPLISRAPLFASGTSVPTAYRAPEQLRGGATSVATDLFAAGVMLYEAVVGAHPFMAEREEMMMLRQLQGVPLAPRAFFPDIPPAVEDVLLAMLAPKPAERPQTADDALHQLGQISGV
ncbi:MAG: MBL fold metallo-hydrolase [Anaerolineales bacterium]